MENFTRRIVFSRTNGATQKIVVRRLTKYESLDYDVKWSAITAPVTGATIQVREGNDVNGTNNVVPMLNYSITTATGNVALQHQDFGAQNSSIEVNFGNSATGLIEIVLIAKMR